MKAHIQNAMPMPLCMPKHQYSTDQETNFAMVCNDCKGWKFDPYLKYWLRQWPLADNGPIWSGIVNHTQKWLD